MSFKFSPHTSRLVAQLSQAAATSLPPDIATLLGEVTALLGALPPDGNLDFLKKPGAWRDRPLPPNTINNPYYVQIPATVETVNLRPATLAAELPDITPTTDSHGNAVVTIPLLLTSTSS